MGILDKLKSIIEGAPSPNRKLWYFWLGEASKLHKASKQILKGKLEENELRNVGSISEVVGKALVIVDEAATAEGSESTDTANTWIIDGTEDDLVSKAITLANASDVRIGWGCRVKDNGAGETTTVKLYRDAAEIDTFTHTGSATTSYAKETSDNGVAAGSYTYKVSAVRASGAVTKEAWNPWIHIVAIES